MSLSARRAWIEMLCCLIIKISFLSSLSARRAWIEIFFRCNYSFWFLVALRKESVDRNLQNYECFKWIKKSLSARRAWIEMGKSGTQADPAKSVALRKESVDRNIYFIGRFLKCYLSLSARRAWIEMRVRGYS